MSTTVPASLLPPLEIASLTGRSRQAIEVRAMRHEWKAVYHPGPGRGGRQKYYLFDSLDPETKQAVMQRQRQQVLAEVERTAREDGSIHGKDDVNPVETLDVIRKYCDIGREHEVQKALARYQIVQHFNLHWKPFCPGKPGEVHKKFCSAFNKREIALPPEVYEAVPKLSERGMYRWRERYKKDGLRGLIDRCPRRKGEFRGPEEQLTYIKKTLVQVPDRSPRMIHADLERVFGKDAVVSLRTVQRFVAGWKRDEPQLYAYVSDKDKFKSQYALSLGSEFEGVEYVNHVVQIDSSIANAFCSDGKRWTILQAKCLYSRRAVYLLSETSNSIAILKLLIKFISKYGVPSIVVRDNGRDYTSRRFDQFCAALNIQVNTNLPFHPEDKGTVENGFHITNTMFFPEVEAHCGRNVSEKNKIVSRGNGGDLDEALSPEELQKGLDCFAESYNQRVHSSLGVSPELKATQSPKLPRFIENPETLEVYLHPQEVRTVGKKGIRLNSQPYYHEGLIPYTGKKVGVRPTPNDVGKVYVSDLETGEGICIAVNYTLEGWKPEDYKVEQKRQAKYLKDKKKSIENAESREVPRYLAMPLYAQAAHAPGKILSGRRPEVFQGQGVEAAERMLSLSEPSGRNYASEGGLGIPLPANADPDLKLCGVKGLTRSGTPEWMRPQVRMEYIQTKIEKGEFQNLSNWKEHIEWASKLFEKRQKMRGSYPKVSAAVDEWTAALKRKECQQGADDEEHYVPQLGKCQAV